MWLILAFLSALLLGFYDVAKKQALRDNSVPAVLLLNTFFSSLIFLPSIVSTLSGGGWFDATAYRIPLGTAHDHILVALKAVIVLSSWAFGYYGIKHLPITIVGPINATRPVMVKMPAPTMMPTPKTVRSTAVRDFLSWYSGSSVSSIDCSIDFVRNRSRDMRDQSV